MTQNHKLSSVYFIATPKQVAQLQEHGYSIIRHLRNKVYEARVTDQQQFLNAAERFEVYTTMTEDIEHLEIASTIAGVDFKEVLNKLERL